MYCVLVFPQVLTCNCLLSICIVSALIYHCGVYLNILYIVRILSLPLSLSPSLSLSLTLFPPPSLPPLSPFLCRHIEFSLKKLQIRGLSHVMGSPGELGKGSGGVTVIDTRTKKILTGLSAPSEKLLLPWIKNHPTYKVYVPSTKGEH